MAIGLDFDLGGLDSFESRDDFVSAMTRWFGREVSWDDFAELRSETERRIMELIFEGGERAEMMIFKLAWLGSPIEKRPLIEAEIAHLIRTKNDWVIREVGGLKHSCKKFSKKCKHTWHKGCELAEKTCDAVAEFWEEHKKEIIIGTAIIATTIAVTAIVVCTGGSGTEPAIAGGVAAFQTISDSLSDQTDANPTLQASPPSPEVEIFSSSTFPKDLNGFPPFASLEEEQNTEFPLYNPLYPQPKLEDVYGREYVSGLYKQWGLPDPYAASERPLGGSALVPESRSISEPTPLTAGEQFARFAEQKIAETKDPGYIDKLPKWHWNSNEPFREFVKEKLLESKDPEKLLIHIQDPNYWTTLHKVEEMFKPKEGRPCASSCANAITLTKPEAPFFDVPLLGFSDQRKVHYHCGIKNNFSSVVEGGLALSGVLDKQFAVQPHLIHSNDIIDGLTKVGLEKLDKAFQEIQSSNLGILFKNELEFPGNLLDISKIRSSVEYEVANLKAIAQAIASSEKPNLKQLHVTFSNGGYVFKEALKQLTPEERDTIIVITTGTTEIIENDLAHVVYNVIGDKDWPSQLCNGGMSGIEAAVDKGTRIDIIKQVETQTGLGGHFFIQPDYQEKISEIIREEISSEYEVY